MNENIPTTNCSWKDIEKHISLVEDPLYGSPADVTIYKEIYGQILDTLDGLYYDSKVSFFFEISRVNSSLLVFKDENVKQSFTEEAMELGLIPQLMEVCEGETNDEKIKRTKSEKDIANLKKKNEKKMKRIQSDGSFSEMKKVKTVPVSKMLNSARDQLEKLTLKYVELEKFTDAESLSKKDQLQKKIDRTRQIVEKNENKLKSDEIPVSKDK
jgi:hypothetical protein